MPRGPKRPRGSRKTRVKRRLTKKLTPERYRSLIQRRQAKTRMTKRQRTQLDRELFVNYCKCLKRLKYDPEKTANLEYPVCASSIYTKRGFPFPPGTRKRCKDYT
jgi:hypothetical protein